MMSGGVQMVGSRGISGGQRVTQSKFLAVHDFSLTIQQSSDCEFSHESPNKRKENAIVENQSYHTRL
jgi:hypothetical protein